MDAAIKNGDGGVSAVVEYDYTAKEPDELDLVKGAIINNIKQMPGGWWEGTLQSNGKTGMFPDNFVRVIDLNDDNTVVLRDKSATNHRRCKVIYSYVQVNDDELSLAVGDVIEFLGEVEEGWWRGRLKNKIGVFPSNFVKVIEPSPVFASKRPSLTTVNAVGSVLATELPPATNKNLMSAITKSKTSSSSSSSMSSSAHRRSFHNSKEDLLSSTLTTATAPAPVTALTNNLPHSHQYTPLTAVVTAATTTSTLTTVTTATTASTIFNNNNNCNNNNMNSSSSSNSLGNMLLSTAITATGAITASDDVAPILPPKPQREHCRVEFPYTPQNDDELELKVGDIIIIHSTELPDRGWWKGELRGKIGVFPDNFVKPIPVSDVSPLNDSSSHHHQTHPQQTHRTAKSTLNNQYTTASTISSNHLSSVAATAKSIIKKTGSTSSGSTHSSHRKDSFGSRDSLNDILSETGLTSGNVAAQRKSLESKNFDLSNAHTDAATRLALKKQQQQQQQQHHHHHLQQQQQQQQDMKGYHINGVGTINSSNKNNNIMASSELRKSTENVDEKNKTTPPPVLTKKPIIPNKKGTTVSSVAGNIFSGLKQKVKSVESKLTTAASHDAADGLCSSKMSPNNAVASSMESNNVAIRRAATIEDGEFDRIERASILSDMRAGRVKAPKRRLPSTSTGSARESNNNTLYVNGSGDGGGGGSGSDATHSDDQLKSDDNSTSDELLAKPKPREWEKKKAPWMEELKASQVKKKTSPNIDNHLIGAITNNSTTTTSSAILTTTAMATSASTTSGSNVVERTSKLFTDDGKIISSSITTNVANSHAANNSGGSGSGSGSGNGSSNHMKADNHNKNNSNNHNSSGSGHFSNISISSSNSTNKPHTDSMSKSLSAKFANETIMGTANGTDDTRIRPNSLSLSNRSLSPSMAIQRNKQQQQQESHQHQLNSSSSPAADNIGSSGSRLSSGGGISSFNNILNHHHNQQQQINTHHQNQQHHQQHQQNYEYENNVVAKSDILRLNELESRVDKLEMLVNVQQRTIDELVRALREETDRVKILRGELDKYAQCVTQV